MSTKELKGWIKNKQETRETGDYLKLGVGVTDLVLLAEIPEERTANFKDGPKDQYVFSVEVNGERKLWSRTVASPFTDKLVDLLAKAPIEISVIRTGSGMDTRYDIAK